MATPQQLHHPDMGCLDVRGARLIAKGSMHQMATLFSSSAHRSLPSRHPNCSACKNLQLLLLPYLPLRPPILMLASTLLCLVVGVADGDSLLVRCNQAPGHVRTQVRIAAIDAPERKQPYGQQAKQALAALCHRQQATIYPKEIDRYGRVVADVHCQGQDAAQHLVSQGMAWVYGRYAKGYGHLYLFEEEAQTAQRGLWAGTHPVPPWQWPSRKQQRQPQAAP